MLFRSGKRLFSNNYEEIAEDKGPVKVLNLSSGMQHDKDRDYKDMAPGKKMSQELFSWACKTVEKLKERILGTIPVLSKKIAMGAVIAFTTASIFAGGLGRNTEQSLQERYSSLNPTFGKNWETTISVNMSNSSLGADYLCEFVDRMAKKIISDYENEHGEFKHANKETIKKSVAAHLFTEYKAKINGDETTYIFDISKEIEDLLNAVKEEDKKRDNLDGWGPDDGDGKGDGKNPPKSKLSSKQKSINEQTFSGEPNPGGPGPAGPDPAAVKQLIQFNNGQINSDNTVTFRYQAASINQAKTDATNYFQLFISACSLNGLTPTAKDLGDLTHALNSMKVTQNGSGWEAKVVLSDTFLNTVLKGLDSTQHNTSRNSKTGGRLR